LVSLVYLLVVRHSLAECGLSVLLGVLHRCVVSIWRDNILNLLLLLEGHVLKLLVHFVLHGLMMSLRRLESHLVRLRDVHLRLNVLSS
jgi:hypothetical protein